MTCAGHRETPEEAHGPQSTARTRLKGLEVGGAKAPSKGPSGQGVEEKIPHSRLGQVAPRQPGFHLQEISCLLKFTFRIK